MGVNLFKETTMGTFVNSKSIFMTSRGNGLFADKGDKEKFSMIGGNIIH